MEEQTEIPVTAGLDRAGYLVTGNPLVDRSLRVMIEAEAERRFRAGVEDWARRDEGRLQTRRGYREEVSGEFRLLLEGLGPWALVLPGEIFPPGGP